MAESLKGLQPEAVFKYFEMLSQIPRESGNEQGVSDFLVAFGKDLGLEAIQEACGNVILKKPATAGYEQAPTVILQGHMDMVCVKTEGHTHDFTKDPLQLRVEGDFLKAVGTSLGADNGIAVAMAMAILADNSLPHPALEVLVTVAEETGMDGAGALDGSLLKGTRLINLDSETEGCMLTSCAGGADANVLVPVETIALGDAFAAGEEVLGARIQIKGLLGGHSGIEIHKNRANGILLLGRVLQALEEIGCRISEVSGGEKKNAIAKIAQVTIGYTAANHSAVQEALQALETVFQGEYQVADPDIQIHMTAVTCPERVWDSETVHRVIALLRTVPNGVQSMSQSLPGLVESSLNAGVLQTTHGQVGLTSAVRSSAKTRKAEILDRVAWVARQAGGTMTVGSDYPAWEYRVESPLRQVMLETYKGLTGQEMQVDAIHAGLECGLLTDRIGAIDMVSIGPNLYDVHTPNEKLSISSTERLYSYLLQVLKALKA